MNIVADLHLHSPYAKAVSKKMTLENIYDSAQKKGIGLVTTGDWTHPVWEKEIRNKLIEDCEGIYRLKSEVRDGKHPSFLLVTEMSCVYHQEGRYHAVHILIFAPNLETVAKINKKLKGLGQNLLSDGRPILNLTCRDLAAHVLDIDSTCLLIPAHAWTPWFGFYGAHGGFDSLDEAFKDYAKYIYAIETGLDSDPEMNWRVREINDRNIVSFSDAHSLPNIGRETTVFEVPELSFDNVRKAIVNKKWEVGCEESHISYTIEFHPQEGKYYFTGHRKCGVSFSPEETEKFGVICPVCGNKLTVGTNQRVEDLAVREEHNELRIMNNRVRWVYAKDQPNRPPFVNLVPLQEILGEVWGVGVGSKKVQGEYERLTSTLAPEFQILLNYSLDEIEKAGGERLREAIGKVREGNIFVKSGYDGIFGTVKIGDGNCPISVNVAKYRQEGLL